MLEHVTTQHGTSNGWNECKQKKKKTRIFIQIHSNTLYFVFSHIKYFNMAFTYTQTNATHMEPIYPNRRPYRNWWHQTLWSIFVLFASLLLTIWVWNLNFRIRNLWGFHAAHSPSVPSPFWKMYQIFCYWWVKLNRGWFTKRTGFARILNVAKAHFYIVCVPQNLIRCAPADSNGVSHSALFMDVLRVRHDTSFIKEIYRKRMTTNGTNNNNESSKQIILCYSLMRKTKKEEPQYHKILRPYLWAER